MKVVHIISRLNIGGPTKLLVSLAKLADKNNLEIVIITGHEVKQEGEILPNCQIIRISGLEPGSGLFKSFQAYQKLNLILRKERPDIVHTHQAKAGFLGRLVANKCKVKTIIHTFHGHVFSGYFSPLKTKIIIVLEKYLAKKCDKVIVISQNIFEAIVNVFKICQKSKVELIHVGIPTKQIAEYGKGAEEFKKLDLPKNKKIIAFIGRLAPIKDPIQFLKLATLFKKEAGYQFLMIGNGPLNEECDKYIKEHDLSTILKKHDWIINIEPIYANIDYLVLTSKNEGTPLTILEAMAAGTLVITTPVGGVVDLINDNKSGLLCHTINQMHSAIINLEKNQELAEKMRLEAKEFVYKNFDEKVYFNKLKELYAKSIS